MKKTLVTTLIASGIALATLSGAAHAKGRLVVYCSATNEMCEAEILRRSWSSSAIRRS